MLGTEVLPLTKLETERHKWDQENMSMTDPRQDQAQVFFLHLKPNLDAKQNMRIQDHNQVQKTAKEI